MGGARECGIHSCECGGGVSECCIRGCEYGTGVKRCGHRRVGHASFCETAPGRDERRIAAESICHLFAVLSGVVVFRAGTSCKTFVLKCVAMLTNLTTLACPGRCGTQVTLLGDRRGVPGHAMDLAFRQEKRLAAASLVVFSQAKWTGIFSFYLPIIRIPGWGSKSVRFVWV